MHVSSTYLCCQTLTPDFSTPVAGKTFFMMIGYNTGNNSQMMELMMSCTSIALLLLPVAGLLAGNGRTVHYNLCLISNYIITNETIAPLSFCLTCVVGAGPA